ncbi:hypothetical protein IFM89_004353 [Coptis chinensis]|uniref:C3H1-type domain-containing protein n=1 Tax=Coptis chinensis TaxID=261450 RepID=A0A835M1I2_9MAGN|nr:hypothetical protein IFM89_004353 [Coptis chinensis]
MGPNPCTINDNSVRRDNKKTTDIRGLEEQLEVQLKEQRESLTVINEALVLDPTNSELSAIHEELLLAIRDAEEGLLHLKRARLLKEADSIFSAQTSKSTIEDAVVELLDPENVEVEPLEEEGFSIGSKCRFHYTDGSWYNGQIIGLDGFRSARVTFLTPTSENMLICKFFLQQRCRFSTNCRLSHELESWDDTLGLPRVVFQDDGSSRKVDGLGFMEAVHFSGHPNRYICVCKVGKSHFRGIAAKMMANMGYREGMGLAI